MQQKDVWDKVQSASALVASIAIPLAALLVGFIVSTSQKESENRIKYVELAVSILRMEPTLGNSALRDWAIEVLAAQSTVPLSQEVREELKRQKVNLGYGVDYGSYTSTPFVSHEGAKPRVRPSGESAR